MDKQEFIKTFKGLSLVYGKNFNIEQLNIFYSFFKDDDIDVFKEAIRNIITKNKFMPTVADIKEEMANIKGGSELLLEPDHEWKEVIYCVRHYGPYKLDEIQEYLNPFTYWVADKLGWDNLFNLQTDETNYMAHRFIEYFKSNQQMYKQQLQLGNNSNYKQLQSVVTNLLENKKID